MVVVLGGMGSFFGAIFGGFIIGVMESLGAVIFPGSIGQIVPFSLFVIILLFKPKGLFMR